MILLAHSVIQRPKTKSFYIKLLLSPISLIVLYLSRFHLKDDNFIISKGNSPSYHVTLSSDTMPKSSLFGLTHYFN